ncbi:response regulator [Flavobacterium rhizosphaerae]|uniref:Response regulator n=1 Tax=Flavobacterium rhizosphaerae TaxID=3163298 RepID=A0ABW8YW01_9FLAO
MAKELTIFYTDDDQEDVEFFREVVQIIDSKKYIVVAQNNGEQLLHALQNPPPHPYIVFLDINMPGMNGLETLKKVRTTINNKYLPVIMFSTSKDDLTIEESRKLGANLYVPKPGMFNQLKKSIEDVLRINWPDFIPTKDNFLYSS